MKTYYQKFCFLQFSILIILSFFNFNEEVKADAFWDVKGTDFWLAFLPNYHQSFGYSAFDSLYIFIAADKPTSGTITAIDRYGITHTDNFTITNTSQVYIYKQHYESFEILGLNDGGNIYNAYSTSNQNESVQKLSFHVESESNVMVYAQSQAYKTSDAFLVFPTDVLGNDYYVMAYKSDGRDYGGGTISDQSTPSQFMIVATYDNTQVTINPSCETYKNKYATQNITLNKGEVYLVQANITTSDLNNDLTGTFIHSTQPVAIFGGQQRATLPIEGGTSTNPSRDVVIEEIPPLNMWGRDIIVAPFKQPNDATSDGQTDLYRILVGYDNTDVSINGTLIGTYNKGTYIEKKLISPFYIEASQPILAAQFKKTADFGYTGSSGALKGDPFMLITPPTEQYMDAYTIINAQAYNADSYTDNTYLEQWITIIFPKTALNSFIFDGASYTPSTYYVIPNTNYYYTHIQSTDGAHTISSKEGFGIFIYGYGYANSYGYLGGMSFMPHDNNKPQIFSSQKCFEVSGMIFDTTQYDSKIHSVTSSSVVNANVNIPAFTPNVDSLTFSASLVDKYLDGSFTLVAIDSFGLKNSQDYAIPGFTARIYSDQSYDYNPTLDTNVQVGINNCFKFQLENYGNFTQTITNGHIIYNSSKLLIQESFPITIAPHSKVPLTICYLTNVKETIIDTLLITSDCADRKALAINIQPLKDYLKPQVIYSQDCFKLGGTIYDTTFYDSRIKLVSIQSIVNSNVNVQQFTPYKDSVSFSASLIDKYLDGSFIMQATDSSGLTNTINFQIPGFTVRINSAQGYGYNPTLDTTIKIKTYYCFDYELENYGSFSQTITQGQILNDSNKLLWNDTFPIVLAPGERKTITICHRTDNEEELYDTLRLTSNCATRDALLIHIIALTDKNPPDISFNTDSCVSQYLITITDTLRLDLGIKTIKIDTSYNCTTSFINENPNIQLRRIELNIIDPYKDTYLSITATDSLGNVNTKEITIPGFTININSSIIDSLNIYEFGNQNIGKLTCDSLELYNYGSFAQIIKRTNLHINKLFSVPQSQLPMTIQPGEKKYLKICYQPLIYNSNYYWDTLNITNDCFGKDLILNGLSDKLYDYGETQCKIPVTVTITQVPKWYILEQNSPNPITVKSNIIFGLPETTSAKMLLYDSFGNIKKTLVDGYYSAGIYQIEFIVNDLPSGVYYYELIAGGNKLVKSMMIVK